jgi:hypothetical protein
MIPWTVHKYADFKGFTIPAGPGDINTALLLHVSATGKVVESFRWTSNGNILDVDFKGSDICQQDILHPYHFRYSVEVDNLDIRVNSTASKWLDFSDLLAKQTIAGFKADSETDVSTDFRRLSDTLQQEDHDLGAALRWSIQARYIDHLTITLQCLPQPASKIRKDSKLSADECPTIILDIFAAATIISRWHNQRTEAVPVHQGHHNPPTTSPKTSQRTPHTC